MKLITQLRQKKESHKPSRQITSDKFYTDETLQIVLESILSTKDTDLPQYLFLMLIVYTGCRREEALVLDKSQIKDGYVRINSAKGGNDRTLPLPKHFYEELAEYAKTVDKYLFNWCPDWCGKMMRRHLPPSISKRTKRPLHAIRHSLANRLLKKTGNVRLVQLLLGHRSITTTCLYLDGVTLEEYKNEIINLMEVA